MLLQSTSSVTRGAPSWLIHGQLASARPRSQFSLQNRRFSLQNRRFSL